MSLFERIAKFVYRAGFHREAVSHSRFKKTCCFFVKGPVKTLEVGTGGGPFTVELLERANRLTVVEVDPLVAQTTKRKIDRWFHACGAKIILGHAGHVAIDGPFHQVVLLEVLEHIKEDFCFLEKIGALIEPGGRLVISTPTASFGYCQDDSVYPVENGGHVRTGYDGPELDYYLDKLGFKVINRVYYGFWYARFIEELRRMLIHGTPRAWIGLVTVATTVLYKVFSVLDLLNKARPYGQITLAIKVNGK